MLDSLLCDLTDRDIRLALEQGHLFVDAPADTLTGELRAAIRVNKKELLALLTIQDLEEPPPSPEGRAPGFVAPVRRSTRRATTRQRPVGRRPAGPLSLWLFDRLRDVRPSVPLPPGLGPEQIAAAVEEARAAYDHEVQRWHDHPPARLPRERWAPSEPCYRCHAHDWYVDARHRWRCGRCTPRSTMTPDEEAEPVP